MWDRHCAQTFTRTEAEAFQGKIVKTSAGCETTITGMFCEGPDSYTLVDDHGHMIYKSHNNCPYVV